MINVNQFIPIYPIPVPWSRDPLVCISKECVPANAKITVDKAGGQLVVQVGENIVLVPLTLVIMWGTESAVIPLPH